MREFRVTLTHRAGELARLTQALAERNINLKSVAGVAEAGKATICLVCEDPAGMRAALEANRMPFTEEEIIAELLEDEIGSVADLCARLAAAEVDLRSLYVLARDHPLVEIGFTVDNPKKAKKALGQ